MNDREGVAALLKDIHRLRERRFHAGDFAACDILADLQTAIDRAGLTNRQRQALYWVYKRDLTQKDAGEAMGVTREAVKYLINGDDEDTGALDRIAQIYKDWDYGEITLTFEERLDEIR